MDYKSDVAIAKRLLAGDERAYAEFFDDCFPRVHRFCARRLPSDEVDDIAMAAMARVFRRLETYRGEAALFTWVCQVARSEISGFYRKRGRLPDEVRNPSDEVSPDELSAPVAAEPEALHERATQVRLIADVLDELPSMYGRALEAKYVEGLSVNQIAEQLGITDKAVESTLSRARKSMKERLSKLNLKTVAQVISFDGGRS